MDRCLQISKKIITFSSGKIALFALAVFIIFNATILPDQSIKAAAYSADAGSPDLSFFYTPDDIYKMAGEFGAAGRRAYVKARFTFDLAWPIVYGTFFLTSTAWLLGEITPEKPRWQLIVFLPPLAVLFDLFENIAAAIVISRYPTLSPLVATPAPYFTLIKWLFVGSSFLVLFVLLVVYICKCLKK